MKVYVVANQKGGVGKTTTALAIALGAAERGKKVLAVDMEPQCNMTQTLGANPDNKGIYDVLLGTATAKNVIQHTEFIDVIPSNEIISTADTVLKGEAQRVYALKTALKPVKAAYDIIVIDTPPAFGTLLYNALTAADGVIIPMTAEIFCVEALNDLTNTIKTVQREYNPQLKISGVLFTSYSPRTILSRNIHDSVTEECTSAGINVFNTYIRSGVSIREAQALQLNMFKYAPKSNPVMDYNSLLDEMKI